MSGQTEGKAMLDALKALMYIEDNELDLKAGPIIMGPGDTTYIYVVRSSRQSSEDTGPYFEGTGPSVAEAVDNFKAMVKMYLDTATQTHERKMALVLRLIGADMAAGE